MRIKDGIEAVHPALLEALKTHRHVSVETTGASPEILEHLRSFAESVSILLVKISAPWSVCLERIATRDPTNQIPLDVETIRKVYDLSVAQNLAFDIELENVSLSDSQILTPFLDAGLKSGNMTRGRESETDYSTSTYGMDFKD